MQITYPKGDTDVAVGGKGESSSHLTVLAIAISIVFIVIALGLWFGYSQSKNGIQDVPALVTPPSVSPEVQQARVYEAIDGIAQCHKNTPDLASALDRDKRQKCYYAVMIIFTTSSICDLTSLDPTEREICGKAEAQFKKDYPKGLPPELQQGGGTTNSANDPTSANGTPGSSSGSSGSTNGRPNSGTSSNTNTSNGSGTVSGNTNTSVDTNTTVASGNTNGSGTSDSGSGTGTNTNTNQTPPEEICVIDTGEVVLLEHTNNCQ